MARALLGEKEDPDPASDVGQQVEIFIVLIFATFSFAKRFFGFDEFDALDPFDHLIAKLIFDAQPQRRAVNLPKALSIHPRSQQALRLQHVFEALGIVIMAAVESFAEGEKGDHFRFRFWPDEINQLLHRNAAPFGDAAPSLDAMMHCDVFDRAEPFNIGERKLDRVLDQTSYFEPEILKTVFPQLLPIAADGHLSIWPEIGRDLLLGVFLLGMQAVKGKKLHWIRDGLEGMLHSARVIPRDVVCRDP